MSQTSLMADVAKRIGRDRKSTEMLVSALSEAVRRHCGELDGVALPSFGTFRAEKRDEQIVTDISSGKRMLLPPEIELVFAPAAKLRKIAENYNED